MLNALVRSWLLYSCQTWSCTKAQMNNVNTTYLRKMAKGGFRRKVNSWPYVLTNEDLLEMAGTEDIQSFVGKQRLKFITKNHPKRQHKYSKAVAV